MTNNLAALSEAATQGLCFAQAPDTEYDFGVPIVATDDLAAPMPTNGMVLWATMQPTEIDALNTVQAEANAAFVVALWNRYRSGDLVLIDREGMRERANELLRAAYSAGATSVHDAWVAGLGQGEADFGEAARDYAGDTADAAIAAILGEG